MKKGLRAGAVLILILVVAGWALLGANRGWTQTAIPEKKIEPITELEFTEYTPGFKPGVELLAAGAGFSFLLFASSFLLPNRRRKGETKQTTS